jgi:hypothetical protein
MRLIQSVLWASCLLLIVGCSKSSSSAPAASPQTATPGPSVTATPPAPPAGAIGQDTNSPAESERDLGTFRN